MMLSHFKAVIFDCDGVLVDSEYLCHLALSLALEELGIEERAGDLYQEFGGVSLALIFGAVEKRHGCELPADFESRYRAVVAELFERELQPVASIEALLQQLTLPFCVASNGPRAKMEHSLGLTGLSDYFRGNVYSAFEVGAWKPDPGLFLAAADGLGVAPEHCLVIEDSLVGVQAAQAAGMQVLRYCPAGSSQVTATDDPAAPAFKHMAELPALLGLSRG